MSNVIERLEALAEKAMPGPWRVEVEGDPECWDLIGAREGIEYILGTIGGYYEEDKDPETGLAVPADNSPDAGLIVAAVNALPDLLKLARAAEKQSQCGYVHGGKPKGWTCLDTVRAAHDPAARMSDEYRAKALALEWACDHCRIWAFAEPLFREARP